MRVMISLPMRGRMQSDIDARYNAAMRTLTAAGHTVADTRNLDRLVSRSEAFESGVKQYDLLCLGEALQVMSTCDAVYFCEGWQDARGCMMEYLAAKWYGLITRFESPDDAAEPNAEILSHP